MKHSIKLIILFTTLAITYSCSEAEESELQIPDIYESESYISNVVAESRILTDLTSLTADLNAAEANAQSMEVASINYPNNLSSVTVSSYQTMTNSWLDELVKAANDDDAFQNPGTGIPSVGEEGGLLGGRLLDENGLELEQMIEKGAFGAALYNHALSIIDGDLADAGSIDKLVEIIGATPDFDPSKTRAAATYARRRSNQTTETGFFYDIKRSLITAKAAMDAGLDFETERDQAVNEYLETWEKSNFATVIFYCQATKSFLQNAEGDEKILGDAMHAYAEGVGFAHGFKGLTRKIITDNQIDEILELLLAPAGEVPTSYRFLNDATLLSNLDQIIDQIQSIYGFTDAEVASFYVNDPS